MLGMVVHAFIPSTWEAEAGGFLSSRPAWATQRNPVLKNKNKKKNKQNKTKKRNVTIGTVASLFDMGCCVF